MCLHFLIVDDHPLYGDALARLLAQAFADAQVSVVGDCAGALAHLRGGVLADLVLLDLDMPGVRGDDALTLMLREFPSLRVVMVSATEDAAIVQKCLAAGASGFVPKSARTEVLSAALRLVMDGGVYLPPLLLGAGLGFGPVHPAHAHPVAPDAPGPARGGREGSAERLPGRGANGHTKVALTPRELTVLRLLCLGRVNKAIANELGISEATVRAHLTSVFRALDVANRTQAARAAHRLGLIADE